MMNTLTSIVTFNSSTANNSSTGATAAAFQKNSNDQKTLATSPIDSLGKKQSALDAKQQEQLNNQLLAHAKQNDHKSAVQDIEKGAKLDSVDTDRGNSGWNALHFACWNGENKLVAELIKKDRDKVNSITAGPYLPYGNGRETPFHLAIRKYLTVKDNVGRQEEYENVMVALGKAGANLKLKNSAGQAIEDLCPRAVIAQISDRMQLAPTPAATPATEKAARAPAPEKEVHGNVARRAATSAATAAAISVVLAKFTGPAAPIAKPILVGVSTLVVDYAVQKSEIIRKGVDYVTDFLNSNTASGQLPAAVPVLAVAPTLVPK